MFKRLMGAVLDLASGKTPRLMLRSNQWPRVRREHLARQPSCQVCGGRDKLEVHHIQSFVEHPELELDSIGNLITLCDLNNNFNCHRIFGHLNNFQQINPDVVKDAAEWSLKLKLARDEMLKRKVLLRVADDI